MLPAGMNYLRKIQLETQRELVHNQHPRVQGQQLGHRRKDRSLTGRSGTAIRPPAEGSVPDRAVRDSN